MAQKTQVQEEEIKRGCLKSSSHLVSSRTCAHVPMPTHPESSPVLIFMMPSQRVWEDAPGFSLGLYHTLFLHLHIISHG